jgi:hypothetical protein
MSCSRYHFYLQTCIFVWLVGKNAPIGAMNLKSRGGDSSEHRPQGRDLMRGLRVMLRASFCAKCSYRTRCCLTCSKAVPCKYNKKTLKNWRWRDEHQINRKSEQKTIKNKSVDVIWVKSGVFNICIWIIVEVDDWGVVQM